VVVVPRGELRRVAAMTETGLHTYP
jgi:hypothetical protein